MRAQLVCPEPEMSAHALLPGVRRLIIPALVLSSLLISAAPGPGLAASCPRLDLDAILPGIVPAIEAYSLPNGLRVRIVQRPWEKTVTVRVAYDVGARDEPHGRSGIAHLFEHMMFKGGHRIPDGGHFRVVRASGGRTNAATDYDTTEYWNTVPARALAQVLFAEADRMQTLRITRANLDNQRAAIQEEGLGLANLPYVGAAERFGLALWAGTPYGHSPLGTDEELAAATETEAIRFHADYYSPGNAVLVVVGGFDPEATRRNITRFFGPLPRGKTRPARVRFEVDPVARNEIIDDPLAPFPVYAVVWHGVGERNPDALALGVLDDLLMGHDEARFAKAVREPFTLDAYTISFAFREVGLLNFVFAPRTFARFEDIQHAIRRETADLRENGPRDQELCRSRMQEQTERLGRLETNDGIAAAIARGTLFHDDPHYFETELRRLDRLDRKELRRVARRYLVDDFSTLEVRPTGIMRWLKPLLEFLPSSIGASLEGMLL